MPVRVTLVPPAIGPATGLTAVTVGTSTYVNWSAGALIAEVPPMAVTVMSTVPAEPAGATAVMEVAELTMTLAAGVRPNRTVAPGANWVPVRATDVPPASGPAAGFTAVTVGTS